MDTAAYPESGTGTRMKWDIAEFPESGSYSDRE
jgi:hypothetical protein